MTDTELIRARWSRIRAAHKADLPALTVARAEAFLRDHPDCGPAWKILGSALLDLARHDAAQAALKRALALCPSEKLWIPLSEMGHLHRARGQLKAAAAWYRQAIDAAPQEASPHIYLGGVLARSGQLSEAEASQRAAIRCTLDCREEAYLNLGLVLRAQGRYEEAATCFEQALALSPKYAAARKALRDVRSAIRYGQVARPSVAVRQAERVIEVPRVEMVEGAEAGS
ncbi:MAG: tetratricopeptide repeat protein [Isosphaeraceae bacterium]